MALIVDELVAFSGEILPSIASKASVLKYENWLGCTCRQQGDPLLNSTSHDVMHDVRVVSRHFRSF